MSRSFGGITFFCVSVDLSLTWPSKASCWAGIGHDEINLRNINVETTNQNAGLSKIKFASNTAKRDNTTLNYW